MDRKRCCKGSMVYMQFSGYKPLYYTARWFSWLERRPVTAEVKGSSPFRVAFALSCICSVRCVKLFYGVLAQLGEHLPYKQGVTGSSPVGPILQPISRGGAVR